MWIIKHKIQRLFFFFEKQINQTVEVISSNQTAVRISYLILLYIMEDEGRYKLSPLSNVMAINVKNTFGVSHPATRGATIPGTVAAVFVNPNNTPAYLKFDEVLLSNISPRAITAIIFVSLVKNGYA